MDATALARLIRANQPCVVLTGAGVSTESGIPDFRSPTGIWAEFDPAEYASLPAFRADPAKVWRFYKPRIAMLMNAQPNAAHLALAALEQAGFVEAVVTQNIDLLHERAGSRNLVEVHGSIRTATCPACGSRYPREDVVAKLEHADAPACDSCGAILKPDVVFFGELLPADAIELVRDALTLPQGVARDRRVPVWGPERDWLAHLTHGNVVLGTYDARKGEEVVTRRRARFALRTG